MDETLKKPGLLTMAYKYTLSLSRWIKAGRPVRNEEEIQTIFHEHCESCTDYDVTNGSCLHCGCRVDLTVGPYRNKIAMGTEHCPEQKW